jgi:hypothetical protein
MIRSAMACEVAGHDSGVPRLRSPSRTAADRYSRCPPSGRCRR